MVKPANDANIDYKRMVREGYDRCAGEYAAARASEAAALELLISRLAPGSEVLDLGCGSGVPVAKALAEHHRVTGVDFSAEQLRIARQQVPSATFIEGDIADLSFEAARFDAITAFYVIFHLPRDQQLELLRSISRWLRPGGHLLCTLSRSNEEPYTEGFFGVEMFWTNFALDEYLGVLAALGFEVVENSVVTHGFDGDGPAESHPLVLAYKHAVETPG